VVVKEIGRETVYGDSVEISATGSGAEVFVYNLKIKPGEVSEIIVVPDPISINKILTISIIRNRRIKSN
jgi:hypothetical protein